MLIRLLSLLLLLTCTVLTYGSECHAASALFPDAAGSPLVQTCLCDGAEDQTARTPPAKDSPPQESENKCKNSLSGPEHFGSVSEKFDSSFCELMVLHLVAKPTGKLLPLDRIDQHPRAPSLVRLSVLLQV